ncbi:MAG: ABC transporter ATP-binding protein [Lachnospiraceae bacterium]
MEERNIAIQVDDVSKVYKLYEKPSDRLKDALHLTKKKPREHHALNHVDISIRKGECVGIIGTNGSGKSTILKIITGVLSPTGGTVTVNGRISALLELGAGFNMEYTGIENVYLNGTMIGFSKEEIDARLQDILDFAEIGEFVNQPVKTYSSGMFVRLAFAVAINIDPEILIVDEALSVGDVFFQSKCYHKFEEFKEQGKTILFVSHDLSTISKYCDRVILLNQGEKLGEGTPRQMIDVYKQVLVGQYKMQQTEADEQTNAGRHTNADGRADAGTQAESRAAESGSRGVSEELEPLEYGTRQATITDYYIEDSRGNTSNTLIKGDEFTVHMTVEFAENLPSPIFAMSIKNPKGIEITGTNTMVEKAFLEPVSAGERKEITFTQRLDLQGGDYLISLGLTGFEGNDFKVYHRLYDVMSISVISDKNTVGYYDMNSKITVRDSKEAKGNVVPYRNKA